MRSAGRSDTQMLLQEARAMELFANDVEVPTERTQGYWDISADLITLVADIEMFAENNPGAGADDAEMVLLRRRLRTIGARLRELSLE